MKRYLLRSPLLRSERIRSLIVRSVLMSCIVLWLWFRLNGRHKLLLKVGKIDTFCTFRVASSHAGWLAGWYRDHCSYSMMASLLTSNDVSPSVVTDRAGWPGPGGHCLGVNPRLATPDVLCVRSNTATCDGKCSQRGKLDKILLIVLKSRSFR